MRCRVKRVIKPIFALLAVCCCLLFASFWYLSQNLPDSISYTDSTELTVSGIFRIKTVRNDQVSKAQSSLNDGEYNAVYKLFGVFPVGNTKVVKVPERYVQVLGTPFGIKIYADGVMVVGTSDVDSQNGSICPAKKAGIKTGDIIHKINNEPVGSNKEVARVTKESGGKALLIEFTRNGSRMTATVTPEFSVGEQCYKLGIWVRDSSAGIGTLTFYDSESKILAGLGHGITDSSTKEIVPIASGELVEAEIVSLEKSVSGNPGELHGRFTRGVLGELLLNSGCGVYGTAKSVFATDRLYPVASKQEIKTGEAQILTTLKGSEPKFYSCKIEKIYLAGKNDSQDIVIRITDDELLKEAGGIVQGMSGSPVIQNGKLIGAVTHVFVNSPDRGYAVFAEDMLEISQSTAQTKLKDAG